MLPLWLSGRDCPPYSVALLSGQLLVESNPLWWEYIGPSPEQSSRQSQVGGTLLWGGKRKKNLEVNSNLYFLDEGEESNSFQRGVFSCIEFEALFCA